MSLPANPSAEPSMEAYVDQAAGLLGLTLAAEHRPGVAAQMTILTGIAAPLLAFHLAPDIEPAAVYKP